MRIALVDDKQKCLEDGAQFPIHVRNCLKIEQAVRDYNFRKIRERQAHFIGHPVPDGIRKEDRTWI